ncbi:efflux RND transporter periplasmic adaptor subunit [Crenobacter sp. SG2303]|uniref:Efflux RND transporter periplasmic adaptor subunit n=1 Tax=Crenobacter oryzisoli TaxID=3056844 RepID=A0ABT7XSF5_9NEIS|nr:efflux RND transporter periplasmic adaptor subunit [Crenobacter sp. SG2303]MDN0076736.1 efflux RND transporter periplasmic adaptor subunit [Crenobacter sp. SG2303]
MNSLPHFNRRLGPLGLTLAVIAALAACGKSAPKAQQPPPVPVSVVAVQPQNVPVSYELVGQANGYRQVQVRARVGGILLKRVYTEGRPVKEGDLLFQIDPAPFQATYDNAKATLGVEEAKLVNAKQNYDRVLPLFKENAVSQKDRDDAAASYQSALASVAAARATLQNAKINLGYTRVTAPITGVTSKEVLSEGSLVSAANDASLLTTISQLDPIYVNFSVSDNDMLRLRKLEQSGKLKLAEPKKLNVRLKLSDGSEYSQAGSLNFTDNIIDPATGTVSSRALFPNAKGQILPGQFVRVVLDGVTRTNALVVPQKAVFSSQQGKMVWVAGADGKATPTPIETADEVGHDVIVDKGLKPGDRVVIDNLIKLRPGAQVKPQLVPLETAHAASPAAAAAS